MSTEALRFYVPGDAGAVAVGADDVTASLRDAASRRGTALDIIRTGSRGLYWLEPMVEVATSAGRIAYGPVVPGDPHPLLDSVLGQGGAQFLPLARPEATPFLTLPTHLTF